MAETEHSGANQQANLPTAEEAENRGRLIDMRQHLYGAVTRQMLEAANLKTGDHILDIAAGTGDQSLMAAQLVGSEGSVLATDISPELLTIAARMATQEGLNNMTTRVMNAEQLELPENSYDAVISRFGLMLIPDQRRALLEIRRVLKPGKKLAAIVWSLPERNPLFTPCIAFENNAWEAEHPGQKTSDPFSLAREAAFAQALTTAGFQKVHVQAITLTFSFPSFADLTRWWGPLFEKTMKRLDPVSRQGAQETIWQAVRPFEGAHGGLVAPAEVLLGTGTK